LILVIASLLAPILTLTNIAEAQATDTIILRGKSSTHTEDQTGDPPWLWYEKGDLPPIMVARRFSSGAVVAAGIVCTCRNGRWNDASNPYPHLDDLLDASFQWMVPGATSVIWYEGYEVFNDTIQCSDLVNALKDLGYDIAPTPTEPITDVNLNAFDILVIPQFELGDGYMGGNPDLFPDDDVQAIKTWVEGGGGLLVMEGGDYSAYNYYKVSNKILEAFDFGFGFQHDGIIDNDNPWGRAYEPLADVDGTTGIGAAYESATGTTLIGLYGICSLAPAGPSISVRVVPEYQAGAPSTTPGYTVVVENPETPTAEDLTCILTVEDSAGWNLTLESNTLTIPVGENRTVTLGVVIPENAEHCTRDNILITATSPETGASDSATCVAHAVTAAIQGIGVSVSPSEDNGSPGTVLDYTVTVTNTGTADDNYNLTASDNTSWSLSIAPSSLMLPAGASDTAMLSVVIPIDAENCTRDGITVTATSIENSEVSDSANCVAHALGVALERGVKVSISPTSESRAPGENLTYYIEVKNTGASADDYRLEVTNTKGWDLNLSVTSFWLNKAERSWGKGILLNIGIPGDAAEGDSSVITVTVFGTGYENHTTCTATAKAAGVSKIYVVAAVVIIIAIAGLFYLVRRGT